MKYLMMTLMMIGFASESFAKLATVGVAGFAAQPATIGGNLTLGGSVNRSLVPTTPPAPSGRYWTSGCQTDPEHNACQAGYHECTTCTGPHNSNAKCCCAKADNTG